MCGICGVLWNNPSGSISRDVLDRMTDALAHRGPDDRGTLFASASSFPLSPHLPFQQDSEPPVPRSGVALGHRRLSIIDTSPLGRQPMANEDGSIWVTFNGEIYNYPDLRTQIIRRGHRFRTETDTEVLVHLYEEEGPAFVQSLSGMFAIGLWDSTREQFLLARDRMGKKPLFYRHEKHRLLFSSELNSLLTVPDVPRELDPLALDQYLTYQYVPFPRTIYKGIRKLSPGATATWSLVDGTLQERPFWQLDASEKRDWSVKDWRTALRTVVSNAVKARLRSDVPLGAFLSGGIDSTIIVGLMQKFSESRVKTFSIGFDHKEYDETPIARETAKRLGTEHHEFRVTPCAEEILPELVQCYGEPFADSSAIPTWYLSQMTRSEVTVALSGDGGDELFAGYDRYKAMRYSTWLDLIPWFGRAFLAGPVRALLPNSVRQRSFFRRGRRFLEALAFSPMERYLQWIAIFNRGRKTALYNESFATLLNESATEAGYDVLDFLNEHMEVCRDRDLVTAVSLMDLQTYLPCDLMTKVDMASMRHSLEVRAPFLDRSVIDLATIMPVELKLYGHKGKRILREVFREYLPPEVENRPKTGFGVPLDYWFRDSFQSLIQDMLLTSPNPLEEFFRPETIRQMVQEHENRQFDHSARLWSLLALRLWLDQSSRPRSN